LAQSARWERTWCSARRFIGQLDVKNASSPLAAMFNLTEEGGLRHAVESSGL
jgi:hypothetical protein